MLKEFEDRKKEQERLEAEREAERRRLEGLKAQQQRDFEEQQRQQAEREALAREELIRQQYNNHAMGQAAELEREILAMRGQYERDQMMLEQYDRVRDFPFWQFPLIED
jgi:huntingtin-interacting protein 1-related protein